MCLNTEDQQKENKRENRFKGYGKLFWFAVGAGVISIFLISFYLLVFNDGLSENSNDWAAFGSYFGSITGFLAFAGVLYSSHLSEKRAEKADERANQADLKSKITEEKTKEESIRREERDLFFKLLELHQERLKTVTFNNNTKKENGIDAFDKYLAVVNNYIVDYSLDIVINRKSIEDLISFIDSKERLDSQLVERCDFIYNNWVTQKGYEDSNNKIKYDKIKERADHFITIPNVYVNEEIITDSTRYKYYPGIYEHFKININDEDNYNAIKFVGNVVNIKYGLYLDQYFRNLYYMLETINKFQYDKDYYLKLFRAQLSESETILCLLDALSDKSSKKFVRLLYKYKILDNIFFRNFVILKFDIKYRGNELNFVQSMLKLYLEERK